MQINDFLMLKPCILDALRLHKSMKNRFVHACRMEGPKKLKIHENTSPRTPLGIPGGPRCRHKSTKTLLQDTLGPTWTLQTSPGLLLDPSGSPLDLFFSHFPQKRPSGRYEGLRQSNSPMRPVVDLRGRLSPETKQTWRIYSPNKFICMVSNGVVSKGLGVSGAPSTGAGHHCTL